MDNLVNFIAEAGLLKRVKRSGWWTVGHENPESVADHSFRTAVLAYVLAHMEGCSPYPALVMALFNDIHEARINDLHKLGQRYVDFDAAEDAAFEHQTEVLPDNLRDDLREHRQNYRDQQSIESQVARDADILECLIQAVEYEQQGYRQAAKFLGKGPKYLKTKSAQALWQKAQKMDLHAWWNELSVFKR